MATFPGAPPEGAGGVRVTSLRFAGRTELAAEVREVPSIGATLVTIRGRAGRSARSPVRPDEPDANEPSVAGASDEGSYLLGVLVGSAFDLLPEDEHVWLGEHLVIVRPDGLDPWEATASRNRFLETSFELRSIMTLDRVRVSQGSGDSPSSLVAVAGGKLYEITVRGTPTDVEGRHRISIGLSRTYPGSKRGAGAAIEATILIDDGSRAVLAVPDPLLEGKAPEPAVDTVFVGISPRFEALTMPRRVRERLERMQMVDRPDQPAVLFDRVEPQYPMEAVEYDAHGEVSLRALVGRNGSVDAVTVVELPRDEGAEFLAAAAAGAVRKWRYLPAHHRGTDVSAWVDITLYL